MGSKQLASRQHVLPNSLDEVLHRTVEDIIDYELQLELFDLSKTFSHIYRLILPQLSRHKMTLGIRTAADTAKLIHSDQYIFAHTILIIFEQLINQAQTGKITVKISQKEQTITVAVSTSEGDHCQPISQLETVIQLCKLLNYRLAVNKTDDGDEELVIQIPLTETDEQSQLKPRILIVEDNDVNATVLQHFLEAYSQDIQRVRNGRQSLDFLAKQPVEFVMMDINMPIMNGIDACKLIRAQKDQPQPVIIAVTADSTEATEQACISAGMNAYLTKPYTAEQLHKVMKPFIQQPD